MLIAGIDEAGYGPVLGPLVVGASVFEYQGSELPDFWELLHGTVSRPGSSATGLVIGDSKKVYKRNGLSDLAEGVFGFSNAGGFKYAGDWGAFLDHFRADGAVAGPGNPLPWYSGPHDGLEARTEKARPLTGSLKAANLKFLGYVIRPVFAPELNAILETRNKSELLYDLASSLATEILEKHEGHEESVFLCDKQGGRNFYGPQLLETFPDHGFLIESEGKKESSYLLLRDGRKLRFKFVMKGDDTHLPIALASMCCKLVRELFMGQFNAWWLERMPGLKPTAGYYTDGMRFLEETKDLRKKLKVRDEVLIRSK
ncbi:MAG: hypothetical protein O3B01_09110 [Planctomycetota bacterium]|nr:hypothetical protein [Planctomycetota bacterium]